MRVTQFTDQMAGAASGANWALRAGRATSVPETQATAAVAGLNRWKQLS